jgi:cytidine deaminase
MNEELFPEQIAYDLQKPGFHVAFVIHQQKIYAAYCPQTFKGPSSAVIKLIQSLFDEHRDHTFFILRNRIFTTAVLQRQCQGMVKIIAKKARGEIRPVNHGLQVSFLFLVTVLGVDEPFAKLTLLSSENQLPLDTVQSLHVGSKLEWIRSVAGLNPRGEVLHDYDRDIACVLVENSGEILGYGLNCNSKNKTLHAEVNLVQRYFKETGHKIPRDAHLYTTRKPCKMCAGMLYDGCEDPKTLHIHFSEEDKSSQHTVLDAVAHWKRLD